MAKLLQALLLAAFLGSGYSWWWAGVPLPNCTLSNPQCFNLQNCAKGFSVYVYPTPDRQSKPTCTINRLGPDPTKFMPANLQHFLNYEKAWLQACATHAVLTAGFQLTENPSEACLLFSTVEGCMLNHCNEEERAAVQSKLWALPHWNEGKNHIVWDFWTDHALPGFDVGKAMVIGGAMTNYTYRPKYDVLLPLTRPHIVEPLPEIVALGYRVTRLLAAGAPFSDLKQALLPITHGRNLTMTFRGYIYGFGNERCSSRLRIFGQHLIPPTDQPDVVVYPICGQKEDVKEPFLRVQHCKDCVDNFRDVNGTKVSCTAQFKDLQFDHSLLWSKFVFAPAGCGPLSFRLSEALGWGAVPILAGNGTLLPLAEETSVGQLWKRCVIHVSEEETATLIQRLRSMGEEEYFGRLASCVQLAAMKIHDLDVLTKQGMCIFASRISEALGPSKAWNNPELGKICRSVGIGESF